MHSGTKLVTTLMSFCPDVYLCVFVCVHYLLNLMCMQALLPDAWPHMLRTLAGFLCPFRAMMQRQQQEAMAAAAAAAATNQPGGGSAGSGGSTGTGAAAEAAVVRTPRLGGVSGGVGGASAGSPHGAALPAARSLNRYVCHCVCLQCLREPRGRMLLG